MKTLGRTSILNKYIEHFINASFGLFYGVSNVASFNSLKFPIEHEFVKIRSNNYSIFSS